MCIGAMTWILAHRADAGTHSALTASGAMAICHGGPLPIVKPGKMTSFLPSAPQVSPPAVVGTIHSPAALNEALRLRERAVDLLEVRVDHFANDLDLLRKSLPRLKFPLIVTVRHSGEGGAAPLRVSHRRDLFIEFLSFATAIDVELRSVKALESIYHEAARAGVARILSWHQFATTPSLQALDDQWKTAAAWRPEIIKFATRTRTRAHLAVLLDFLVKRPAQPRLSVMGMGDFGAISRLTLGCAGSCLNYGFLGERQIPGQWPAVILRQRLAEILPAQAT
jgi:3-dehydroquinate dehydratase-1